MASAVATSRLISAAYNINPSVVIAGDFNYKEIDWENDYAPPDKQNQSFFITGLQDCFLDQHVTEPTRYRENEIPSLLDLILSSEEDLVRDLEYLPPLGESDHICMRFNVRNIKQIDVLEKEKLNIFKTDYSALIQKLTQYNWHEILNSSFEEDYESFVNILEKEMKVVTPKKTTRKA